MTTARDFFEVDGLVFSNGQSVTAADSTDNMDLDDGSMLLTPSGLYVKDAGIWRKCCEASQGAIDYIVADDELVFADDEVLTP